MKNINYEKVAFVLIKPPSTVVSTHRIDNRDKHDKLIRAARDQGLILYYAKVSKRGQTYSTEGPLIADEDSVTMFQAGLTPTDKEETVSAGYTLPTRPATPEPAVWVQPGTPPDSNDDLRCPYCKSGMSSTSGLTLHVKSKHPEHFSEYKAKR